MTNLEKFNNAFVEVFSVETAKLNDDFSKDTVNEWDSVHQLSIVANLEENFDVLFEPEDIMAFTSYKAAKEIMNKYDIQL